MEIDDENAIEQELSKEEQERVDEEFKEARIEACKRSPDLIEDFKKFRYMTEETLKVRIDMIEEMRKDKEKGKKMEIETRGEELLKIYNLPKDTILGLWKTYVDYPEEFIKKNRIRSFMRFLMII